MAIFDFKTGDLFFSDFSPKPAHPLRLQPYFFTEFYLLPGYNYNYKNYPPANYLRNAILAKVFTNRLRNTGDFGGCGQIFFTVADFNSGYPERRKLTS